MGDKMKLNKTQQKILETAKASHNQHISLSKDVNGSRFVIASKALIQMGLLELVESHLEHYTIRHNRPKGRSFHSNHSNWSYLLKIKNGFSL